MIEDKDAYRAKSTELLDKKEELIESLSYVDAVKEMLKNLPKSARSSAQTRLNVGLRRGMTS